MNMNPDVKLAFDVITAKQKLFTEKFNYYDGKQPLVYLTYRLREIFNGLEIEFMDNWCSVVIDAVKERMNLKGFMVPEKYQKDIDRLWVENEINLEADEVHEAALVTGEAYVIVWPDEGNALRVYYNDPRLCYCAYRGDNPREMRMAAKLWVDEDEKYRLTLYYADHLEYYVTAQKAESVSSASSFRPMDVAVAENPYGRIPVFHFQLERRGVKSELTNAIPLQNGVNKMLNDMMVAAEFGAFKQRWIISQADVDTLKNAPNEIWNLPAADGIGQDTQVGEFGITPLSNYIEAIDKLAGDMGRITRTPKHYFFTQSGDPSGEALIAQEAPLNKKVRNRIERFNSVWKKVAAFMLELEGKDVKPFEVVPNWEAVETVQPKTQAEIRLLDTQAGIPLVTCLKREGWSKLQIEELIGDLENQVVDNDGGE